MDKDCAGALAACPVGADRCPRSDRGDRETITGERLTSQQYLKEFYHEMKSKAKKMLETKKSKEIESSNIMIRTYVTYGYPSDKILEFANKHQVNLIVMEVLD